MEGDLNAKNIHLCFPSTSAKINTYTPQFLQQPPSYIHSQSFFLSFFPSKMNFKSVCVALRRRCVCIINNTARERDGKTQFRKVTFGWSKQASTKKAPSTTLPSNFTGWDAFTACTLFFLTKVCGVRMREIKKSGWTTSKFSFLCFHAQNPMEKNKIKEGRACDVVWG